MICEKCQAQCSDTAKFCSECGHNLQLQRINAAPMAFDAANGAGFMPRLSFGSIAAMFMLVALVAGAGIWAWLQTPEQLTSERPTPERQTPPISTVSRAGNADVSLDKGEEFVQPLGKQAVESITNTASPSSIITQTPIMQGNPSESTQTVAAQRTQIKTALQSKPSPASVPVRITTSAALASEVGIVRGFPPTGNPPSPPASVPSATATAAATVSASASASAKRNDWYDQYKTELSACSGNFFAREFCKQQASWRHCQPNKAWGKVPECVENKTESERR
jgi:hypothetical protein